MRRAERMADRVGEHPAGHPAAGQPGRPQREGGASSASSRSFDPDIEVPILRALAHRPGRWPVVRRPGRRPRRDDRPRHRSPPSPPRPAPAPCPAVPGRSVASASGSGQSITTPCSFPIMRSVWHRATSSGSVLRTPRPRPRPGGRGRPGRATSTMVATGRIWPNSSRMGPADRLLLADVGDVHPGPHHVVGGHAGLGQRAQRDVEGGDRLARTRHRGAARRPARSRSSPP